MNEDITTNTEERTNGASGAQSRNRHCCRPSVNILEAKDELLLKADMPGTRAENVSVDYVNGTLTLHATVERRQPKEVQYLRNEYGVADFHREFLLDEDVDSGRIAATYKHGVLTVHLPKTDAAKPKTIEVRSSSREKLYLPPGVNRHLLLDRNRTGAL